MNWRKLGFGWFLDYPWFGLVFFIVFIDFMFEELFLFLFLLGMWSFFFCFFTGLMGGGSGRRDNYDGDDDGGGDGF